MLRVHVGWRKHRGGADVRALVLAVLVRRRTPSTTHIIRVGSIAITLPCGASRLAAWIVAGPRPVPMSSSTISGSGMTRSITALLRSEDQKSEKATIRWRAVLGAHRVRCGRLWLADDE